MGGKLILIYNKKSIAQNNAKFYVAAILILKGLTIMNHRKILLSTLIAVSMGGGYASCQAQGNSKDGELEDNTSQSSHQSHHTQHNGMEEELLLEG